MDEAEALNLRSEVKDLAAKIKTITDAVPPDYDATDLAIKSHKKEIDELREEQKNQRGESKSIITGVLMAGVISLIVMVLSVVLGVWFFLAGNHGEIAATEAKYNQATLDHQKSISDLELRLQKEITDTQARLSEMKIKGIGAVTGTMATQ